MDTTTTAGDPIVGVNPRECVHVQCSGWEECRYKPDPIGPELPDLILDRDGKWWGNRVPGSGRVWWYGSGQMVTWSALCRIRDGLPPVSARNDFPEGPWIGSDYAHATLEVEAAMAKLVSA